MSNASLALQRAIHATLAGSPMLSTLLGGARIFDDVPRGATAPYVVLAQSQARDWSTGTEAGDEHTLSLHVWSEHRGRAEALAIIAAIRAALHEQPLALDGHRLISLRFEFQEARRDGDGSAYRGLVRFRATTEPAG